jgi:hypothetical protein
VTPGASETLFAAPENDQLPAWTPLACLSL